MTRTDDEARIAQLEAELVASRVRLRELDHRVKNDLQLIASVFVLQLRRLPEGEPRIIIRGALERINAIAAVHRRLDVGEDPAHFEASGVVRDVAEEAAGAARRSDVTLAFALEPVVVPSRQAAPLALITGELVRNAYRHGLGGRPGRIEVAFGRRDGALELGVRDDGSGLAEPEPARGFGLTLAALMAQQLRGGLELAPAGEGLRACVRFPEAT